jgi:hypothetical protein
MNHTDEELHVYAREVAASLKEPDKKQLRLDDRMKYTDYELHAYAQQVRRSLGIWNVDSSHYSIDDIVRSAKKVYKGHERLGVRELVEACSRIDPRYHKQEPMWKYMEETYG